MKVFDWLHGAVHGIVRKRNAERQRVGGACGGEEGEGMRSEKGGQKECRMFVYSAVSSPQTIYAIIIILRISSQTITNNRRLYDMTWHADEWHLHKTVIRIAADFARWSDAADVTMSMSYLCSDFMSLNDLAIRCKCWMASAIIRRSNWSIVSISYRLFALPHRSLWKVQSLDALMPMSSSHKKRRQTVETN